MWKRIPVLLIAVSTLTACACGTPPTRGWEQPIPDTVESDCPELPPAESGRLPDLVANHVDVTEHYHKCRESYRATMERIRARQAR